MMLPFKYRRKSSEPAERPDSFRYWSFRRTSFGSSTSDDWAFPPPSSELDDQEDDTKLFYSPRRRISFSTSTERDTPYVKPSSSASSSSSRWPPSSNGQTPSTASSSIPSTRPPSHTQQPTVDRQLPTPPASSPEVSPPGEDPSMSPELIHHTIPSQPTNIQREQSPQRTVTRKRPTLMDLLSSSPPPSPYRQIPLPVASSPIKPDDELPLPTPDTPLGLAQGRKAWSPLPDSSPIKDSSPLPESSPVRGTEGELDEGMLPVLEDDNVAMDILPCKGEEQDDLGIPIEQEVLKTPTPPTHTRTLTPVAGPSSPCARSRSPTPLFEPNTHTSPKHADAEMSDVGQCEDEHQMGEAPSSPLSLPPSPPHEDTSMSLNDREDDVLPKVEEDGERGVGSKRSVEVLAGGERPKKRKKVSVDMDVKEVQRLREGSEDRSSDGEMVDEERGRRRETKMSTSMSRSRSSPRASSEEEESAEEDEPLSARVNVRSSRGRGRGRGKGRNVSLGKSVDDDSPGPRMGRRKSKSKARSQSLRSPSRNEPLSHSLSHPDTTQSSHQSQNQTPSIEEVAAVSPLPLAELEGLIIETLASARASSMSVSALWSALIRGRPALSQTVRRRGVRGEPDEVKMEHEADDVKGEGEENPKPLDRKDWHWLLAHILSHGHETSGVFGKVESSASGSDSDLGPHDDDGSFPHPKPSKPKKKKKKKRAKPLTTRALLRATWFYQPLEDPDRERAGLITSTVMRRPEGKRRETMKYKRYYWKPLGKWSRWDGEDEL